MKKIIIYTDENTLEKYVDITLDNIFNNIIVSANCPEGIINNMGIKEILSILLNDTVSEIRINSLFVNNVSDTRGCVAILDLFRDNEDNSCSLRYDGLMDCVIINQI